MTERNTSITVWTTGGHELHGSLPEERAREVERSVHNAWASQPEQVAGYVEINARENPQQVQLRSIVAIRVTTPGNVKAVVMR